MSTEPGEHQYVVSADYEAPRTFSLNPWIDFPGVPHTFIGGSTVSTWSYQQTFGTVSPSVAQGAFIDHEYSGGASSHHGRATLALADFPSYGDYNAALERLTGARTNIEYRVQLSYTESYRTYEWAVGHKYVYGHVPANAEAAAWTNPPDIASLGQDAMDPANDNRPAINSARCDGAAIN